MLWSWVSCSVRLLFSLCRINIYILGCLDQPQTSVSITHRVFLAQSSHQPVLGHEHEQSESPSGWQKKMRVWWTINQSIDSCRIECFLTENHAHTSTHHVTTPRWNLRGRKSGAPQAPTTEPTTRSECRDSKMDRSPHVLRG